MTCPPSESQYLGVDGKLSLFTRVFCLCQERLHRLLHLYLISAMIAVMIERHTPLTIDKERIGGDTTRVERRDHLSLWIEQGGHRPSTREPTDL